MFDFIVMGTVLAWDSILLNRLMNAYLVQSPGLAKIRGLLRVTFVRVRTWRILSLVVCYAPVLVMISVCSLGKSLPNTLVICGRALTLTIRVPALAACDRVSLIPPTITNDRTNLYRSDKRVLKVKVNTHNHPPLYNKQYHTPLPPTLP